MIGKTISHYKILSELGRGGMGVVYKAEDLTLQRIVALKFLAPHVVTDEEHKKRMLHEARATAALDHPNISTVYGIEEAEGHTFIVMAFIEGESLSDRIESGQMDIIEGLDIAIQTARGLSKAHAAGIVHRDIKPGNILITGDEQVKIVDFGLAKLASQTRLTQAGTILGTMAYMSPEQVTGADTDASSDIWAIAVVLYEMLAGQAPFRGEMDAAVMYSIMNEDPEPLTEVRKDATVELERILEKALSKDPDKRMQSVDEFLSGLEEIRDRQTLGMKQGRFAALKRTKVRKRITVAAIVAAVAVSAVFLIQLIGSGPAKIESVAVLPFMNLSGDTDQEYIADGMTWELISQLGQVRALRVTSRTSVMQFKGTTKTLPQIGKELDVDAIVEASVMLSGERLRIVINLIQVDSEQRLWSDEYDRKIEDVFSIYSEVAQAITGEIDIALTSDESERLTRARPVDPEAHEAYLIGKSFVDKWSRDAVEKGILYIKQALEHDPDYAQAHAGLATAYMYSAMVGGGWRSPDEVIDKAREAATRALELDGARIFYAVLLRRLGGSRRFAEALDQLELALQTDPLNPFCRVHLVWTHLEVGDYAKVYEECQQLLDLHPEPVLQAQGILAKSFIELIEGREEDAVTGFERCVELTERKHPDMLSFLCNAYETTGRHADAMDVFDEITALAEERYVSPVVLAELYATMGNVDEAFEYLEQAYELRCGYLFSLADMFKQLRSDPRWDDLVERVGLPDKAPLL
jgi:TolB-like protein/predicted Ser/Thr protein kinase